MKIPTRMALVKRVRRIAAITSAAGIVIPFGCGYALGQMLPESVMPDPNRRLLTSLFLATALSISSVKIVVPVLREVDYLGRVILATAILDDTIGWTILAFIAGLAAQGKIVIEPVLGERKGPWASTHRPRNESVVWRPMALWSKRRQSKRQLGWIVLCR